MPRSDVTREEVDDLMKYGGVYHKIIAHDIECDCFCSVVDCTKEFDTLGEIVIQSYSNLYHIKCFGKGRIKKPSFDNDNYIFNT